MRMEKVDSALLLQHLDERQSLRLVTQWQRSEEPLDRSVAMFIHEELDAPLHTL